jgi:SAM-dependent methyltransferase
VACARCGFLYADDIPSQRDHDAYYESSGKHVYDTGLPEGIRTIQRSFYRFIADEAKLDPARDAVLDVGSSMGHFLNLFKQAGFTRLQGVEPSSMARQLARETYDIDVAACTLERFAPDQAFSLVTICGVLEHIVELRAAVEHLHRCTAEGGLLFVAVPDAAKFGARPPREPFLEFALEHVDFFTQRSLDNLMAGGGFAPVAAVSKHNDHYDNDYLLALYRKRPTPASWTADPEGPEQMRRYVSMSEDRMADVRRTVDALVASREPVAIWGAGQLTARLLATTDLAKANIVRVVDRSRALQGTPLCGVVTTDPESLRGQRCTVLVASYVFGAEIEARLREDFAYEGRVVLL